MNQIITEIQIIPVKADKGLVAFCNFVLFNAVFFSSVAVFTRPNGGFRLVYPNKLVSGRNLNVFHPISKEVGDKIEAEVSKVALQILQ